MNTKTFFLNIKFVILGIIGGGIFTFIALSISTSSESEEHSIKASNEKKPLYWVAPMDANYRRDKPGKSPMGMDLVPVYDDGGLGTDEGVGTIHIKSNVLNNLGVRTSLVSYKSLNNEINTVGFITYDEDKLVHIYPRVKGWIEKLYIKANGEPIKKGQPLYEMYSPILVNAQEEFLLALNTGNKRLISSAENRLIAYKFSLTTIEDLYKNKQVKRKVTFYAGQDGVVDSLSIREGSYVTEETMMLSIVNLNDVWLKAEVVAQDINKLTYGNKVSLNVDAIPGKIWDGEVTHIHPSLNVKTRTGIARIHIANVDEELKPYMFANVTIDITESNKALVIPKEALIRTGKQDRVVLALGEGSFKSIAVRVGRYDNEYVEILRGLSEGESVVSSGQFLLDSESSKSSDFKRMHYGESKQKNTNGVLVSHNNSSSASATGLINSIMPDHGMINISRSAIEKWNRPAATVDFITAEGVNLKGFSAGMNVQFTFTVSDGDFIITKIEPLIKE